MSLSPRGPFPTKPMTLERINARLLEDARKEAEGLIQAAESGLEMKLNREELSLKEGVEKGLNALRKELREKNEKTLSLLRSDYKKQILERKNGIIDRVFEEAIDGIVSLERQEYLALLEEWLERLKVEEKAELMLSNKDLRGVGPELVRKANDSCTEDIFSLATSAVNIRGGFILRTKGYEIDRSLECIISHLREEPLSDVAEKLFGK